MTDWRFRLLVCSLALGVFPGAAALPGEVRPNVIVFFTDDHGYADLSCQGIVDDVSTPHIDRLAAGGLRMDSGYVSAPQCVPSRAGLLTGRYQNRFGVESNGMPLDGFDYQVTIAERLRQAGYATGMTGKWHLGPGPQIPTHGFDDVFYKHSQGPGWANFRLDGKDREPGRVESPLYHIDANTAAACAFIRRHRHTPFFFYCAYRAPHVPLDAPEKYLKRFPGKMPERRRRALAMIAAVDAGVGKVMATLRECGLEERTLVVLIGDNGAPLKIHKEDAPGIGPGWDGSLNDPLNGEKGMLAEGGIRVPFVAYWKNTLPAGVVYREPVISLDIAATALALAGQPPASELDGVDLLPYWTGKQTGSPHEYLYWRWIAQSACRSGRWKYLRGGEREYLFDLAVDREEKHNVIGRHPETAKRLKSHLEQWAAQLQPPGLATKPMSAVWEAYYDYYLDGKPAPPRAGTASRGSRDGRVGGIVVRGGKGTLKTDRLVVQPSSKNKATFLAATGFELADYVRVRVRMRAQAAGSIGVAWRERGQRDFVAGQVVKQSFSPSGNWQTVELTLPAKSSVIHFRLLLPPDTVEIDWMEIQSDSGSKRWDFEDSPKPRGRNR